MDLHGLLQGKFYLFTLYLLGAVLAQVLRQVMFRFNFVVSNVSIMLALKNIVTYLGYVANKPGSHESIYCILNNPNYT
jgi:hypothetical protein